MRRIAALRREQNETGIPFPQGFSVFQPDQAGKYDRVGARFRGMEKDHHRQGFSFTRTPRLIEASVTRVAIPVPPWTQPCTAGAHRVARGHNPR